MKIEQLRRAIEIYKTGSINRAAQNLYIAQSSLSASLRALELELGHDIFNRTQNGISLTPFGECFLEHAQAILMHIEQIEIAGAEGQNEKSTLRLDVMVYYLMFASHALSWLYDRYRGERVEFNYMERTRSEVIAAVGAGKAEIGLIMMPSVDREKWLALLSTQGIEYSRITVEPPYAILGPKCELYRAGYSSVTPSTLANREMIIFPEENELFRIIDRKIYRQFSPSGYLSVCDRGSLVSMLNQTSGYYLATRNKKAYTLVPYYDNLVTLPVTGARFTFEIGYIHKHHRPISQIAKEYLAIIQEMIV